VTALDGSGNVVPTYTGTVHFTSSDASAGSLGNYTFAATDMDAEFQRNSDNGGEPIHYVTDTANSGIVGSATVIVSPLRKQTGVRAAASNAVAGAIISPAVTVRVLDPYGNLVSGDSTDQVTLALGNNPGSGTLSGTVTAT